jgi:hypothetical protein
MITPTISAPDGGSSADLVSELNPVSPFFINYFTEDLRVLCVSVVN